MEGNLFIKRDLFRDLRSYQLTTRYEPYFNPHINKL